MQTTSQGRISPVSIACSAVELVEVRAILAGKHVRLAHAQLESGHARADVLHPRAVVDGVLHWLAKLAVVEHVETGVGLLVDDIAHRARAISRRVQAIPAARADTPR